MLGKQNINNCSEYPESGETHLKSLRKNLRTEPVDESAALAGNTYFSHRFGRRRQLGNESENNEKETT